jgi:hypothetical protein
MPSRRVIGHVLGRALGWARGPLPLLLATPAVVAGTTTTLTSLDGTPFSIHSIDLAKLTARFAAPAQTVTCTGTLVGGATVTQAFTVPGSLGSPTLATYTFQSTFANLTSLPFGAQLSPFYQFTNVRLNQSTVPEPGAWALLGTGLLAVGGVAARRKRTTV